jgi:sigma-E factor negative regulatory protein RseA
VFLLHAVSGRVNDGLRGTDAMSDTVNEQLSACLDGELPEAELDLLLKRVAKDQELGHTLGRYALTGEALRGAGAVRASTSFADRVAAAIAAEESITPQKKSRINPSVMRWLRPAAGFAVAAGVATVAVLSLQPSITPEPAIVAQVPAAAVAPANDSYVVPANTVSNFVPATRLTNYVVAHSEYSSPLGMRTVLSGVLSDEDEGAEPADGSADASSSSASSSSSSAAGAPRP